ncbi:thioredoxin-like domain-containing protein [Rhodococcus aerolatus]
MTRHRTTPVRAPELAGTWVSGPADLTLRSLRGRVVLLHLMTAGCINCVHVVDELRPLARRWADELVVLGVHSPKFDHEAEPDAVRRAVRRLGIDHPVLADTGRRTFDAYAAKAWPTLVVVDPAGYVVHTTSGEGRAAELDAVVAEVVARHGVAGAAAARPAVDVPDDPRPLRDPAGLVVTPAGTLLVADTGHGRVVELAADGSTELARHDVPATGLALLPADVADAAGVDLVVADRAGHRVLGLHRGTGEVRTLAGTGAVWRPGDPADGPGTEQRLASPTAVAWWPHTGELVVAQAGNHTLSALDLGTGHLRRLAGRVTEGLGDGPAQEAFLAQPTALAVDGERLWFVDAESSALRWLADGVVRTAVGAGLFDFGHRDGPAARARLQHPEGLTVAADGSVLVADTYDGAVRRFDPATGLVSTLAAGLVEPRGVAVLDGRVLVLAGDELVALPGTAPGPRPAPVPDVAPGPVELRVRLTVPDGTRTDDRDGPATRLDVTATPAGLLADTTGTGLTRTLTLTGEGQLHVRARAALCEAGTEHPVCRVVEGRWDVDVRAGGTTALVLPLGDPG